MRLLFRDPVLRQEVNDRLRLDLEFAGQFVDSDLVYVCHYFPKNLPLLTSWILPGRIRRQLALFLRAQRRLGLGGRAARGRWRRWFRAEPGLLRPSRPDSRRLRPARL